MVSVLTINKTKEKAKLIKNKDKEFWELMDVCNFNCGYGFTVFAYVLIYQITCIRYVQFLYINYTQ